MRRWTTACHLSALSLSIVASSHEQEEPTTTEILECMAKGYAGCETYRDSGVVTTVFHQERGKRTDRKPFSTAFIRPDRLRYEFKSRGDEEEFDRYLVWGSGQDIRTWWDVRPGVTTAVSLEMALAGAAGVSGGSAYTVPALLLQDEFGGHASSLLQDAVRIEDAWIGERECYRIRGGFGEDPRTLWIDKDSWLLRRIEGQHWFPNFRTETVTDYEPEIDVLIPESLLTFDPPVEDEETQVPSVPSPLALHRQQGEPTGEQIMERMEETYAECRTYRDSGVVTTVFLEERGKRTVRKPFTTAFVRPDRFRFEFQSRRGEEEVDRYLIWKSESEVRTWWDVTPGIEVGESIDGAIAAATGVSGGSAQSVPGYLMPGEVRAWLIPSLRGLQRIEDADIGTARCYRITGTRDPRRCEMTLWIDTQTLLLRRIEERKQFDDFRTEEITDYEPEIDLPIPESLLLFDPPEGGR